MSAIPYVFACQALPPHSLANILPFLITKGLSDGNMQVSMGALNAGREIMRAYGEVAVLGMLPMLEVGTGIYVRYPAVILPSVPTLFQSFRLCSLLRHACYCSESLSSFLSYS